MPWRNGCSWGPLRFTQYTSEWLDTVNRGGLFPLNDQSFRFFCSVEGAVEGVVRAVLQKVVVGYGTAKQSNKKTIVESVTKDENVLFLLDLVSQDIVHGVAVITIRGFSLASHWMEAYKLANKTLLERVLVSERA